MAFLVNETKTTPFVLIDSGEITLIGRSIPEDAFEFYEPVLEACRNYVEKPARHTAVTIHLEYINSGSKKFLTSIFNVLEKSYLDGHAYEITWIHDPDDEALYDLGMDLKGIIKIPITIKPSS